MGQEGRMKLEYSPDTYTYTRMLCVLALRERQAREQKSTGGRIELVDFSMCNLARAYSPGILLDGAYSRMRGYGVCPAYGIRIYIYVYVHACIHAGGSNVVKRFKCHTTGSVTHLDTTTTRLAQVFLVRQHEVTAIEAERER